MANVYATRPDAKQMIADAGLTQVELAERTGISRVMINKALHGHYRLRGAYAWRIAQALADHTGVPRDEMFNRLFERAGDTTPSSLPSDE